MKRVKVIKDFTLKDFDKLIDIKRAKENVAGKLFTDDTFICDEKMYDYLNGNNSYKISFVELVEEIEETEGKIEYDVPEDMELKVDFKPTKSKKKTKKKSEK